MEELTSSNLALFVALVVPGFVSMRVFALLQPTERFTLKESLLDSSAFGVANFALMSWAIAWLRDPQFVRDEALASYGLVVTVLFVAPALWAVLTFAALKALSKRGVILARARTSWDHFFRPGKSCWVIVHLKDGRRIGGLYGPDSYASLYPSSGHLYLQELWTLDESGRFSARVPDSRGLILRPDDYHFVELFEPKGDHNAQD